MTNLLVSLLDKAGVTVDKLGDSTGRGEPRYPHGDLDHADLFRRRRAEDAEQDHSKEIPCVLRLASGRAFIVIVMSRALLGAGAPPVVEAVKAGTSTPSVRCSPGGPTRTRPRVTAPPRFTGLRISTTSRPPIC